ncbi:PREDICTED: trypsin theta-like [Rhagoletis zephyria]|uniref:trypsin theta-like n=1 Tax=Rhagoletis zephyria TaxID=28612 RepID=UPI000811456A|nr:PREDICTED: trypsin theta-like [Rhagoletis zephyria]
MENDIAVLKLAESVNANYLELATEQPASGSSGILVRFNANNTVAEFAETILSIEDCTSGKYKYEEGDLFNTMLCALPEDTDACGGPAGSPLCQIIS